MSSFRGRIKNVQKITGKLNIGQGTYNYNELFNLPVINDVVLRGNLTLEDLKIQGAEEGKGLSSNDFTNEDKEKLDSLQNYDDTELREAVANKVDKKEGFDLSEQNYTLEEKQKLASLENYNDTEIKQEISNLDTEVDRLTENVNNIASDVSKIDGNVTSINAEVEKNKTEISSIKTNIESINQDIEDISEELEGKAEQSDIPTKVSELQNDSGFINNSVSDLVNYYLKTENYNKQEVDNLISAIKNVEIVVEEELPEVGETNKIYFVPKPSGKEEFDNIYNEYVWVNEAYELIGDTKVDLTGYVKDTDYASDINSGIIKLGGALGASLNANHNLQANVYSDANYNDKSSNIFISKGTLENIKNKYVKDALVNNTIQLTDEEKIKIEMWLGLAENYLSYSNEIPYQVLNDYNPAHKKYVDDLVGNIDSVLETLTIRKWGVIYGNSR